MDLPGYPPGEALVLAEAAEFLGCNASTLKQSYRWPWALSHTHVLGRPVFFRSDLEKRLRENPRPCWRNAPAWKEQEAA